MLLAVPPRPISSSNMVPFRYVAEAARAAVMLLSHAHDHADFFLERVAAPLRSHHYDDPRGFSSDRAGTGGTKEGGQCRRHQ